MGKKNCEFTQDIRNEIVRIFLEMETNDVSMIFKNEDFAYWTITVERPLRLRVFPNNPIPENLFKKHGELISVQKAISMIPADTPTDNWTAFSKATKLKRSVLKKIRPFITEKDPVAKPIEGEADADLRETENVPVTYEGGIEAYLKNEVLNYAPDAYIDDNKTVKGYEISFAEM